MEPIDNLEFERVDAPNTDVPTDGVYPYAKWRVVCRTKDRGAYLIPEVPELWMEAIKYAFRMGVREGKRRVREVLEIEK
jgi:hypothetical protein